MGWIDRKALWTKKSRIVDPSSQQPAQDMIPQITLPNKPLFRLDEVAEFCEVHVNTVRNWIESSVLKAITLPGNRKRVPRAEFLAFLLKKPSK